MPLARRRVGEDHGDGYARGLHVVVIPELSSDASWLIAYGLRTSVRQRYLSTD